MKITVVFLLVAVGCYFNPASANCMSRCSKSCWRPHVTDFKCLQRALVRNQLATVNAMGNVLCAYDRCKAMKNKMELVRALRNLKEVTQCPLDNILGNDFTIEELNADVDSIMPYLLRTVADLLNGMNVGSLSTPVCGPLKPLLTKVIRMLYILGIPSLDGRMQNVAVINGGKRLLKTVAVKSPGLLPFVLELLLGPGSTFTDLIGLIGGLTGGSVGGLTSGLTGATDLVGGLTGSLVDSGVTETLGGVAEGIRDTAAELTNTLGEATNGLGGVVEILNVVPEVTKAVNVLTDKVVKTVESVTNDLVSPSGAVGGLTGILGTGLLGGTNKSGFSTTETLGNKNLLGNDGIANAGGGLTSGVGEMTGMIGGITGGSVEGLTSGLTGATDLVGGLTGSLVDSGVTETLGGVAEGIRDTAAELTNTLGEATNGLGGVVEILNVVPEVTKAVNGLTDKVVKTVESVTNDLVSPSGVVGGLTGIPGTGLLGGTNKSGFSTTETLGNKNLLGNDGIATAGGELTGGAAGRISARPENSVLTAQQNAAASGSLRFDASGGYNGFKTDTSGGLLQGGALKTGGGAGGLLGGPPTRKFNSLLWK